MSAQVPLTSIRAALQGVIPSPFATCAADGRPNITYMSVVQYIDTDRIGLSRQFFRKTSANLDENPTGQVLVVDPETMAQYLIDTEYLYTETEGPTFDALNANLEAVAAQTGMSRIARLRGVDIHRVVSCVRLRDDLDMVVDRGLEPDMLRAIDEFVRRMSANDGYDDGVRVALRALEDIFGFAHAVLLECVGDRLCAVAANGYGDEAEHAEVEVGHGLIGVAVEREQVVCIANLARSGVMAAAVDKGSGTARALDLPGPERVHSAAAVPLLVNGGATGVLYLESEQPGHFGPANERLLRILGHHLAAALAAAHSTPARDAEAMEITYYQADDSVFADRDYIIKGVPGRILWKLLREYMAEGRSEFTNRELRLDERLELPPGKDNLESRLVSLRRRLEGGPWGITLERIGRGRMALRIEHPLALAEVPTGGPMRRPATLPEGRPE